jgi:hypothetical protein
MSDLRTAHSPIVIDRVERSRGDGDTVRLRLRGRRLATATEAELDALLVVRLRGLRHRFAASKAGDEDPSPGSWRASFTVPDWAVPVEYGQASLWVGEASVPVPPVGTRIRMPEPAAPAVTASPALSVPEAATLAAAAAEEAGRAGPLADALLRETVSALHAELEQRSGRETALEGALERARAELVARTASQTELEATHVELRTELARLVAAVADQQAEFERRLEQARGDAERVRSELAQARIESDRARAELLGAREQEAGIAHTRQQLAAVNERLATALASDQVRAQEAASLREQLAITSISRDAAVAEAGGLRAELSRIGSELAVTREQAGVGEGELGAAQQLLEDARALTAQLREQGRS